MAISSVNPMQSQNLVQLSSHPSRAASRMYEITVCTFMGAGLVGKF